MHRLVKGGDFSDNRGTIKFFNSLDMKSIVRMYEINPKDTEIIRAWQAHKEEHKWFYCSHGKFIINLVSIANFEKPLREIEPKKIVLESSKPEILQISGGYASGIKAAEKGSKLLVFSNFSTAQSKKDDFRFSPDFWNGDWKLK